LLLPRKVLAVPLDRVVPACKQSRFTKLLLKLRLPGVNYVPVG